VNPSISAGDEGKPPTEDDKAKKASKKMKKQEPIAQDVPKKDQGDEDEKRKKKKNEGPSPKATVRGKSVIKKSKVHKALKTHTSSDSGVGPKPTEKLAADKDIMIEQDHNISIARDKVPGPKDTDKPQPEPMVEGQDILAEGQQDILSYYYE
jgi:hypothetical protein